MDDTAENWDAQAARYQKTYEGGANSYNRALLEFLRDRCGLVPGARVLDVGCGVGKYGVMLAGMGCEVTLNDISPEMLRLAGENLAAAGGKGRLVAGDFAAVPDGELTGGKAFDLAISTMSPGVRDAASAAKLSRLTRGWCFLARFYSWDAPAETELERRLGLADRPRFTRDLAADCAGMARFAREAGYAPETVYMDYDWADRRGPGEFAERFCSRYYGAEPEPEMKKSALRAAESMAGADGAVADAVRTRVAWIWWKTK